MLLALRQAWCCDHAPGEPVPVPRHPLSEESFPGVQSELPLVQLHATSYIFMWQRNVYIQGKGVLFVPGNLGKQCYKYRPVEVHALSNCAI